MATVLMERPRARRLPTVEEMDACDAHIDAQGGCDGCPHLRVASSFDAYCATGYVWPSCMQCGDATTEREGLLCTPCALQDIEANDEHERDHMPPRL